MSSKELIGRCLCGEVKVQIAGDSLNEKSNETILCHCKNCQHAGGGLASFDLILPEEKVLLLDEKSLLKKYDDTDTKSKTVTERYFCGQCGSPVYSKNRESKPKKTVIKLSLLRDEVNQLPKPKKEVFCKDMMDWEKKIDGIEHYDQSPK